MCHSTTFATVRDPCFSDRLTHGSIKASGASRFTNFHLYFSHCWKGSWKCSACSDSTQTALRWQECSRNKIQLYGADLCPYRIWWVFRRGCFPKRFMYLNLVLSFSQSIEHVQMHSETGALFTMNVHRRVQFTMTLYLQRLFIVSRRRLLTQFWILTAEIGLWLLQDAASSNFNWQERNERHFKLYSIRLSLQKYTDNKNFIFTFTCKFPVIAVWRLLLSVSQVTFGGREVCKEPPHL